MGKCCTSRLLLCGYLLCLAGVFAPTPSLGANVTLTVSRLGAGGGAVSSSPVGIACGTTCSTSFAAGTGVTLTARPYAGSAFGGWGGACSGTGGCTVTLSAAATVTATFAYTASAYSRDYVQKAYVAYYGRPADPGGQSYWAGRMDAEGQSLNAIIGAFGYSDEFNRRYGGLSYAALVTKIYQQALGRDPDPGGLNWYVGELQAGRRTLQTITLDVLNGATTAPDSTVVANRLDVAAYYTTKVAAGCAYGTEQVGVASLAGVSAAAATVTAAKVEIDSRCDLSGVPRADAGAAQTVAVGRVVTLDGSASTDPEGDLLTYAWTLTAKPPGSAVVLVGGNSARPTFAPDSPGTYTANLIVNDGKSNSASSAVTVTALSTSDARKDAARLLRQATFGASREEIENLMYQGYEAWLDEQFAMPLVSHFETAKADPNITQCPWCTTNQTIWKQIFTGTDQLRQRVMFALSQIYVVSLLDGTTVTNAPCGVPSYLDMLNRNAFGNARALLRDVTLHPIMGEFLSMKESAKADPVLQTQPDENYAREVMQLFSVGLVMLKNDGSVMLDSSGKPMPTFNEETVKGFAKALSGWTFAGQNQTLSWRWLYPDIWDPDKVIATWKACPAWSMPMEPWLARYRSADNKRDIPGPAHDMGAKQLLVYPGAPYSTLPAGQSPQADLENVIDNVFHHPNVGPFIGKQLIQRLVTSNPSPQYVERVAGKFNDNGSGIRGDMKAVVRAILLDNEARSLAIASQPSFGKLTEPVVRFVQFHRAFNASKSDGVYDLRGGFNLPTQLNQSPLMAPSVFNFFSPGYTPTGPLSESKLVGPEFEITSTATVAGFADFTKAHMVSGFNHWDADPSKRIVPDYTYYFGLTSEPVQLVEELNLVLAAGGMSAAAKAQIADWVSKVTVPGNPAYERQERLNVALWLIANSPDYLVQK